MVSHCCKLFFFFKYHYKPVCCKYMPNCFQARTKTCHKYCKSLLPCHVHLCSPLLLKAPRIEMFLFLVPIPALILAKHIVDLEKKMLRISCLNSITKFLLAVLVHLFSKLIPKNKPLFLIWK